MRAIDDGPAAAPAAAERTRNAISDGADQAEAMPMANRPAAPTPTRYVRLCPQRSPALPAAGPTMPKASIGPVMTQVRVVFDEPRSTAIRVRETARIVMVKPTVKRPNRAVARTTVGCLASVRRPPPRPRDRAGGAGCGSVTPG